MSYGHSIVLFRRGWAGEAARLARDARVSAVAPIDGKSPRYPLVVIVGR
jgi:hypothetical protein